LGEVEVEVEGDCDGDFNARIISISLRKLIDASILDRAHWIIVTLLELALLP
jgi:hypothetical protein